MEINQLEENIVRIAKEIFSIPKEQRGTSCEFFTLRTKLADSTWRLLKLVWKKKFENASCEIMKCVNDCITKYDGSPEEFIKYLYASLKNAIRRANSEAVDANRMRIKTPEKKRRAIKSIMHYCESCGKDISDLAVRNSICKFFGITEEQLSELMILYDQSFVQSDTALSEVGTEFSILDSEYVFERSHYDLPENKVLFDDDLDKKLKSIDCVFKDSQVRTQPYLSALLTRQVLEELESKGIDNKISLGYLRNRHFAATQEARDVIEAFLSGEKCPAQQDVAARFGRNKTDASRAMSKFKDKMEKLSILLKI